MIQWQTDLEGLHSFVYLAHDVICFLVENAQLSTPPCFWLGPSVCLCNAETFCTPVYHSHLQQCYSSSISVCAVN